MVRTVRGSVALSLALTWLGAEGARADERDTAQPVVLELFTSQGCSSCPPAEVLLSRLGLDERIGGWLVPLAFHVDYWDQAGWSDPFSSSAWSRRQEAYSRALRVLDGVYTPQLVVDGQEELNGARGQAALDAIRIALERPRMARLSVKAVPLEAARLAMRVNVEAEITGPVSAPRLDLLVAVYENGLATRVARGENRGRALHSDFIVRRLETALSIDPARDLRGARALDVELDRRWNRGNLGVAALLQDPESMRILAAATARPPTDGLAPR